jgi:Rrf2 family protein
VQGRFLAFWPGVAYTPAEGRDRAAFFGDLKSTKMVRFTMLQLTKRSEYGLAALLRLVEAGPGAFVSVREICARYPLPRRFVAETLKDLHAAGLVDSQRGVQGGYTLARPAREITLGEVVAVLEGKPPVTQCELVGAWLDRAPDVVTPCPVRNPLESLRTGIWNAIAGTTLEDLIRGRFVPPPLSASHP